MSLSPPDRTHDTSRIDYHVKDLKTFGEVLTNAAAAAFPNRAKSRYRGVYVLLLSWEDDNLQVIKEVLELQEVFRVNYGFEAEEWKIPSRKSHNSLAGRLLKFVDDYDDKENLLIVYYGGHGGMDDDRRCIWSCNGQEGSPEVRWFGLQTVLEEAKSDVLILLDCCAAASSTASADSGITEVIAACGFETWTPGVGEHSFSRSLVDELKFLSAGPLFTAAMLHNKVLSRIKYWKPRYNAGTSLDPRDLWAEKRKTPVYILLASEAKQRSIELAPFQSGIMSGEGSSDLRTSFIADQGPPSTTTSPDMSDPESMDLDINQSSLDSVWPDQLFECPKVLITIALEENQWLQAGPFSEWLASIPALAKCALVEGVYHSDSTLLILSMPVAIWNLLPQNPALSFIGFVRSRNLINGPAPQNVVTSIVPTMEAAPRTPNPVDLDEVAVLQSTQLRGSDELHYMQVFIEEVAIWMDSMDSEKHFTQTIPANSVKESMLLNAILAAGATHLTQVDPNHSPEKASQYYNIATRSLDRELSTNVNRNISLCAITAVVLTVTELMIERPLQLMNHIARARALIKENQWDAKSDGIGAAVFWVNVTMETLCSLQYGWQVAWHPGHWGVDMNFSHVDARKLGLSQDIWTHRIVNILARTVNFWAQDPLLERRAEDVLEPRISEWTCLKEMCRQWFFGIPGPMRPLAFIPKERTTSRSVFPEIWLLSRPAKVAQLFYHTILCLLAQTHPTFSYGIESLPKLKQKNAKLSPGDLEKLAKMAQVKKEFPKEVKEMEEMALDHSRQICGIVVHPKDRGVASASLQSLRVAAELLQNRTEQDEILVVLGHIRRVCGWRIGQMMEDLKKKWGWVQEENLSADSFLSKRDSWLQDPLTSVVTPSVGAGEYYYNLEIKGNPPATFKGIGSTRGVV